MLDHKVYVKMLMCRRGQKNLKLSPKGMIGYIYTNIPKKKQYIKNLKTRSKLLTINFNIKSITLKSESIKIKL